MVIEQANSACTVPDWPPAADPVAYPWQPGLLGDWGLGQDVCPTLKPSNHSTRFVTVSPFIFFVDAYLMFPQGNLPISSC